jgi:2-keto-4-pentenoate hydratase
MSDTLKDPRIASGMRKQFALRQQHLDAGAKQIGWKVGLGAPAALARCKLTAPLVGFLLDRAELKPGAAVSLMGWAKPVAEIEIAAYIARDVPANADDATVRSAIGALGLAIELADLDSAGDDVEEALARDIWQRHVILGAKDAARAGANLDGLTGKLVRNGKDAPVPADLESGTGRIVDTVRHVADVTAAMGDGLRAGQFIICGAITGPMFVEPGETGADFTLAPIGTVSVKFSGK